MHTLGCHYRHRVAHELSSQKEVLSNSSKIIWGIRSAIARGTNQVNSSTTQKRTPVSICVKFATFPKHRSWTDLVLREWISMQRVPQALALQYIERGEWSGRNAAMVHKLPEKKLVSTVRYKGNTRQILAFAEALRQWKVFNDIEQKLTTYNQAMPWVAQILNKRITTPFLNYTIVRYDCTTCNIPSRIKKKKFDRKLATQGQTTSTNSRNGVQINLR